MAACVITGIVCFIVGTVVGFVIIALMIAAGDDSREHEVNPFPKDEGGSDNGRC